MFVRSSKVYLMQMLTRCGYERLHRLADEGDHLSRKLAAAQITVKAGLLCYYPRESDEWKADGKM